VCLAAERSRSVRALGHGSVSTVGANPQAVVIGRFTPFGYTYTMPLNIKDPETERLAAEVAALAGESKTAAVRQALRESKRRLLLARTGRARGDRIVDTLQRQFWPQLAAGVRGSTITRAEMEAILGFGPAGV
jgi:antitoxin VapB